MSRVLAVVGCLLAAGGCGTEPRQTGALPESAKQPVAKATDPPVAERGEIAEPEPDQAEGAAQPQKLRRLVIDEMITVGELAARLGILHPHLPRPVKLQEIRAGKAIS